MISSEEEARIQRLYHAEKWPVGTIARELGRHHSTVERVIEKTQGTVKKPAPRPSIIDPYVPFILETFERYPKLHASRLFQMVKQRGYPGKPDHFRHLVARLRPQPPAETYLRLRTLPGEQAQVDWGHFGKVQIGRAQRFLAAFVMVLSFSRWIFARFYLDQRMENFLRGHEAAFQDFGGVARVLLYDNLKSAVLERNGEAIRFHPTLLDFAGHYRFEPRPVGVRRANEKGRVERAIRYLRRSFFAARQWSDLDELNEQVQHWCHTTAAERLCPEDREQTVRAVFEQEKGNLLALPEVPYPTDERCEVRIPKTPYARFDGNDYSVPHTHARRILTVVASPKTVRILDGEQVLARHPRSYSRHEQIEDPAHIEALVQHKREARVHRGQDRLLHAVPRSREMLQLLALRGKNLGSATAAMLRLLDTYGAAEVEAALDEVLLKQQPRVHDLRLVLERRCHERNQPPQLPVALPDDPRVRNLQVKPHALQTYDGVHQDDDETQDDE